MECKECSYHISDGRCLFVAGCPYKVSPSFQADGTITFTMSEASSRNLIEMLQEQDREWFDRLMDGKEKLTLTYGSKKITLIPEPDIVEVQDGNAFIDAVIRSAEQDKWISVEERLPERRKAVIVYVPQIRCSFMAFRDHTGWKCWSPAATDFFPMDKEISHWMPAPEPPEE